MKKMKWAFNEVLTQSKGAKQPITEWTTARKIAKNKMKNRETFQKTSTATLTTAKNQHLFYFIAHCNKDKRNTSHTTLSLALLLSNVHLCVVIVWRNLVKHRCPLFSISSIPWSAFVSSKTPWRFPVPWAADTACRSNSANFSWTIHRERNSKPLYNWYSFWANPVSICW